MDQTATPMRRSRGGGRDAKQARRASPEGAPNLHLRVPYIKRGIPTYDIAGEEQLVAIERTVDRILAEIGIEFRDDPETVEMFRRAGAQVTHLAGENYNLKFEPGLIQKLCATVPPQFTQHARNPANNVEIGGDSVVFSPSYGSPFVMDLDRGRRYGTIEDFENFIKLAQSSPNLHHSGGTICEPTDVPVNKRHLDMVYAHMRYSDRGFMGSITAPERGEDSLAMCRILFGETFVDENCVILANFNVTSPLVFDGVTTKTMRIYAAAGQACITVPFLLCGAVAPVTTAGAVAQNMAESLVGVALTQLVRPGVPTILGSFVSSMSLRTGSPTFGTPEPALGSLLIGQLARRLNLPLRCAGNFSTSKLPDAQAMTQGQMSMMSAVQCGANFILHSAGFLDGLLSMSYEKFMLDADLCGMMHSYLAGVKIDEESLGFEALAEGGPGAHMFGAAHTIRNYSTAFYESSLDDNQTWETWHEQGGTDAMARANAAWKTTLAEYQAPPIDAGIDEALRDFVATKKQSMGDAWY